MTAKEVNKITNKNSAIDQSKLDSIYNSIKEAALRGESEVRLEGNFTNKIISQLNKQGYNLRMLNILGELSAITIYW